MSKTKPTAKTSKQSSTAAKQSSGAKRPTSAAITVAAKNTAQTTAQTLAKTTAKSGQRKQAAAAPPRKATSAKPTKASGVKTLAFDVGGSGLKATVLDERGEMVAPRVRVETPKPCPPAVLLEKFKGLIAQLPPFDRVSVGFPGVVRHGRTLTGVNLDPKGWMGYDLGSALRKITGKPVIVINDADMQGLGAIKGKGVEMVITLGTGLGSALFEDGRLAPHLELGHIPFRKEETFEEQLGNKAFKAIGPRRWNKRLQLALKYFRVLTSFDKLYIGGGNASEITFKLPPDIEIVSNAFGLKGGIWVWKDANLQDGIQK